MKASKFIPILVLFIFLANMAVFSQNFKEANDSLNHYLNISDAANSQIWCEKAVAAAEKDIDKRDSAYLNLLLKSYELYYNSGNGEKSIETLFKIESARKETLGEMNPDYIRTLFDIALTFLDEGWVDSAYIYSTKIDGIILNHNIPADYGIAENYLFLGLAYQNARETERGETCIEKGASLMNEVFKEDNIDLAYALHLQGIFYKNKGDFALAKNKNLEAYDMIKRLNPKPNKDIAQMLCNIGIFFSEKNEFQSAENFYLESEKMYKEIFSEDTLETAFLYSKIGNLYNSLSLSDKAGCYLIKSLEIYRKLLMDSPDIDYATTLHDVGAYYNNTGEYKKAYGLLIEAINMLDEIIPTSHPFIANALNSIAYNLTQTGDYEKAYDYNLRAYDMAREMYEFPDQRMVPHLLNLAQICATLNYNILAEKYFSEIEDIYNSVDSSILDKYGMAIFYDSFAGFYENVGNINKAIKFINNAVAVFQGLNLDEHVNYANSLSNLGNLYRRTEKYEEALQCFLKAKNIYDKKKIKDFDYVRLLTNIAAQYDMRKQYDIADGIFNEAIDLIDTLNGGANHPIVAYIYEYMGVRNIIENNLSAAEKILLQSYKIRSKSYREGSLQLGESLKLLCITYFKKGDFKKADYYFDKLFDNTNSIIKNYFFTLNENEKQKFYFSLRNKIELFEFYSFSRVAHNPIASERLYDMALTLKNLLFESQINFSKISAETKDSSILSTYEEWKGLRSKIAGSFRMTSEEILNNHINLDSLIEYSDKIEKRLIRKFSPGSQIIGDRGRRWESVRNSLGKNEAAIEIVKITNKNPQLLNDTSFYAAYILKSGKKEKPIVFYLGGTFELESKFAYLTEQIEKNPISNNGLEFEAYYSELYNLFWQGIDKHITNIKTVYISPDGIFNKININVFLNPVSGKYLLEEKDVRLVSSTKNLINRGAPASSPSGGTIALFGAPEFSDTSNTSGDLITLVEEEQGGSAEKLPELNDSLMRFNISSPLPNTMLEVNEIARLFEENQWLPEKFTGIAANEDNIKHVKSPAILHIATHGVFLNAAAAEYLLNEGSLSGIYADNPMFRSYLAFSGANNFIRKASAWNDGFLTAYEAMGMELENTELVVLSACEAGSGEIVNGEGVYGLQRAFLHAGAKIIVMSLKKVFDKPTREFMVKFYENYFSGADWRESFRKAQAAIKERYGNPFIWGSFVMMEGGRL